MEDSNGELRGHELDWTKMSPRFATDTHPGAFWESLGRAVGTFARLEWTLKQAILALTGTITPPPNPEQQREAVEAWSTQLQGAVIETLNPAIDRFLAAARRHPLVRRREVAVKELGARLRAAVEMRNLVCHAARDAPGSDGASRGCYFTGKGDALRALETRVTSEWLDRVAVHTGELVVHVVNVVTRAGYRFPGAGDSAPGRPLA